MYLKLCLYFKKFSGQMSFIPTKDVVLQNRSSCKSSVEVFQEDWFYRTASWFSPQTGLISLLLRRRLGMRRGTGWWGGLGWGILHRWTYEKPAKNVSLFHRWNFGSNLLTKLVKIPVRTRWISSETVSPLTVNRRCGEFIQFPALRWHCNRIRL